MKYKLITFANTNMSENPIWDVYGYVREGHNEYIGTFDNEYDAMNKAHSYGLPVVRGLANTFAVVKALKTLTTPQKAPIIAVCSKCGLEHRSHMAAANCCR